MASTITARQCCCNPVVDDCEHCLQLVWGDTIETVCCRSKLETIIFKVPRPARTVVQCLAPTPGFGCPSCTGTIVLTKSWDARPDIVVAYSNGQCDWAVFKEVVVPDVFNPCNPPEGYDFACDSAPSRFGTAPLGYDNRWSVWRNDLCAADPNLRWWADIQCYNGGDPIPVADYAYAPTVYSFIDGCTRGDNDGTSYRLADYFLGTVHRRIRWERTCWTDSFNESGELSLQCMTPAAISFIGGGCPLFEMDLYSAADTDKWGRYALSLTLVQRLICAFRDPSGVPDQADLDAVFAHPALMLSTRDWRPQQDADNAFLATLYPAEYGPCAPQTDTLGVSMKKCWPAIRPELVVPAVASLQADCLPTPTMAMEANPAWQVRRNAFFRCRPASWYLGECDAASCGSGVWSAICWRYDGQPFGDPTSCSSTGGVGTCCDFCDPPPEDPCCTAVGVSPCTPGSTECYYLMGAASCDGVLLVYGETEMASCAAYYTCIAPVPGECVDAVCQGYYLYGTYMNRGYIFPINRPCMPTDGTPIPYQCVAADPPANVAQLWPIIEGQAMLARAHARNILFALGGADCNDQQQCAECDTVDCDPTAPPVTPVPSSQVDAAPCGTFVLEGAPHEYNPCLPVCWTADPCTEGCVWFSTVPDCVEAPSSPCT